MGTLYTLGEWTAKEGREEEFVAAWDELARWTENNIDGAPWAKLLRDREEPRRLISFGPWRDDDAVAAWRDHLGFRPGSRASRNWSARSFPHTLDVAAEVGPATPDP